MIGRVPDSSAQAIVKKGNTKLALINIMGVKFELSFIVYGLPRQTVDSLIRPLDKAHASGADKVEAFPSMLLRGTELHAQRHELGLREGYVNSAATARIEEFISQL